MDQRTLLAALRLQDIKRWHMVRTTRPQNVAEHSHRVAVLAADIAERVSKDKFKAAYYATIHDAEEAIIGDTATHVKAALKRQGADFDRMTDVEKIPAEYEEIIKAADYIEAILWIECNAEGVHAQSVAQSIRRAFNEFCMGNTNGPVYRYVLSHAQEGFVVYPKED